MHGVRKATATALAIGLSVAARPALPAQEFVAGGIAEAVATIERLCGCVITYEDPPTAAPADRRIHFGVFSRICGSLPAPVADRAYGTGRLPSIGTSETRTPFWWSVSLCC
jgi:hypothetical protein